MLADWLPFYEKHRGELKAATREAILKISPDQVDRVLAPKKIGRGAVNRRTPKTNTAIKALVPIRAQCWDAKEPGWLEADTVAHCGGDMGGSFLWTLTATDSLEIPEVRGDPPLTREFLLTTVGRENNSQDDDVNVGMVLELSPPGWRSE